MHNTKKDIERSLEFLTFLWAGFYGQIAFEQVAAELAPNILPANYLDTAHRSFDRLDSWFEEIVRHVPIFSASWSSPETFEAIAAMDLMRELKGELTAFVGKMEEAALRLEDQHDESAARVIVGCALRAEASREAYLEKQYSTWVALGQQENAQRLIFDLSEAKTTLKAVREEIDTLGALGEYPHEVIDQLVTSAPVIVGDMRAQVHGTNVFLNCFAPELTFEAVEFGAQEAALWQGIQAPPYVAGLWRAYGFTPQEAQVWRDRDLISPWHVARWRLFGFSPDEAKEWESRGFGVIAARALRQAGHGPEEALKIVSAGAGGAGKGEGDGSEE